MLTKTNVRRRPLASNLWFYAKIWAKVFPLGFACILLFVPVDILVAYETIRIPRLVVESAIRGDYFAAAMRVVGPPLLVLVAAKTVLSFLRTCLMALAGHPMSYLYAAPVNEKLFSLRYQNLIDPNTQNVITRAKNIALGGDGNPIHMCGLNVAVLLAAICGAVVFTSDIVRVDLILLVLILLSGAINLAFGLYVGKTVRQAVSERGDDEKKESYLLRTLEDPSYAKDIRLYRMRDWLVGQYHRYLDRYSRYLRREANVRSAAAVTGSFLVFVRDLFAYVYLIHRLVSVQITIAEFVFLTGLIIQFSRWMDAIVAQINALISFSTSIDPIRDFLDLRDSEPDSKRAAGGEESDTLQDRRRETERKAFRESDVAAPASIEFRNVGFRYPESDTDTFRNFNLSIRPGERIALVGINGAGKTTLMLLLMGLLQPTDGEIRVDGKPSRRFNPAEYRKLFSPVFQDIQVFPETIRDNIAGSREHDADRMRRAVELSGLAEIIADLPKGLDTPLVKNSRDEAIDLSGGQTQRLLLARALYKDAKINILDEPTAALDPIAESRIYEEYSAMSKGKTSIFISHRLASTQFCDRILLLEYGTIVEEGSHAELMAQHGKYREMYEIQSRYYSEDLPCQTPDEENHES